MNLTPPHLRPPEHDEPPHPAGISGFWCAILVALLLAFPAWIRGGTRPEYQAPMIWLTWLALAGLVFLPILDRHEAGGVGRALAARLAGLFKDPVLYPILFFLGLLLIQWRNARWPALSPDSATTWFTRSPPVPWLPSSVTASEALEMLHWFFPALAAALCVRHGLGSRRDIRLLYWLMALNAAAVSAFGIIQFISGTHSMYWRQPVPLHVHFFAGFGYANHAGAFLTLSLCIGLTLALYYLGRRTGPDVPSIRRTGAGKYVLLGLALPIILVGLYLSLSRAAILLAMAALVVFAWTIRSVAARALSRIGRFHALISMAALAILAGLAIHAYAGKKVRSEMTGTTPGTAYEQTIHGRLWQAKAALEIFRDHPWFGVGGWGYRYYVGFYADEELLRGSALQRVGAANAHNDPSQFLAEFGGVGFVLLLVTSVLLAAPAFLKGAWRREMVFFPLLAAAMTLAHSLIDLPFRCPAVLATWFVLLSSAGTYAASLPGKVE